MSDIGLQSSSSTASAPQETGEPPIPQVVGFFSKEKMSWDNNNLACIIVFPPWQRRGLGQKLMAVSYELSKREDRLGGPEKRESHLNLLRLRRYARKFVLLPLCGTGCLLNLDKINPKRQVLIH